MSLMSPFQSECHVCKQEQQRATLSPVSKGQGRLAHKAFRRLASRLPVRRSPVCARLFFPVTARLVQQNVLYLSAPGVQGRVRKANISETRSLPFCCC